MTTVKARYPELVMFGQFNPETKAEDLQKFFTDHGFTVDFVDVNKQSETEGVVVFKIHGASNTVIAPFGMLLAVAPRGDKYDYIIVHPQVFLTFYDVPAQEQSKAEPARAGQTVQSARSVAEQPAQPAPSAQPAQQPVMNIDGGEL